MYPKRMMLSLSHLALVLVLTSTIALAQEEEEEEPKKNQLPSYGWSVDTYPKINSNSCFTKNNKDDESTTTTKSLLVICDPDSLLNDNAIDSILNDDIILPKLEEINVCVDDDEDGEDNDNSSSSSKLEIVIAIAEKTDFQPYYPNFHHRSSNSRGSRHEYERQGQKEEDEDILKASESFTMELHNKWGIGAQTKCGDTGILVYISIRDRVIYISKGSALNELLTSSRIDTIINKMKPFLRSNSYQEAIETSLYYITEQIEKGKPYNDSILFLSILMIFGGVFFGNEYYQSWQRRKYAQARMHLNQLDRDNALALQGKYKSTSCPICFEPFQRTSNNGDATTCTDENSTDEQTVPLTDDDNNTSSTSDLIGSDGLPLRLLRCGHVFDETCYQTWVSTGQGDVRVCPICKEDISAGGDTTTRNDDSSTRSVDSDTSTSSNTSNNNLHRRTAASSLFRNNRNNYNYYHQERLFRLSRLAYRYPQYIRPYQVDRWSDRNYNGRLVQDDGFVRNDPVRQQARASASSNSRSYSSSSSFGGGGSSGGGGGRW